MNKLKNVAKIDDIFLIFEKIVRNYTEHKKSDIYKKQTAVYKSEIAPLRLFLDFGER